MYSKKKIKRAFLEWQKDVEENPQDFMNDTEIKKAGYKEVAEKSFNELISRMDKY